MTIKNKQKQWIKTGLILAVIFVLAWKLPAEPIDPWNLFSLKKAAIMIFALSFIQALGSILIQSLGSHLGAILTGFFGGLISSTATTASLARKSRTSSQKLTTSETLTFLAATIAMLVEAAAIFLLGTSEVHLSILIIFIGPIVVSSLIIIYLTRKTMNQRIDIKNNPFELLPILKLSAFIISILAVSKILQNLFGQNGLLILTFIVSLFEIHGSIIANVQLHDSGAFGLLLLGTLFALSIVASYVSKLFLVSTLGSPTLRVYVTRCTLIVLSSLIISWLFFIFYT